MKLALTNMAAISLLSIASASIAAANDCNDTHPSSPVSIHCGDAPSAVFDNKGRLWVAFVQDQYVYVSYSENLGKSYSVPVAVNSEPENVEYNGENRPKIIVDANSKIFISWTKKTSPRFTGEIRFSRSNDGGKTFEAPRTINDDGLFAGHRFESLYLTESGHLYITWIDKRDLEASIKRGENYTGAAIYYAVSTDQGASFSANYRVANNSCECCRIAIAPHGAENIAILWRQIFGVTTRDHAIAVLTPEGTTQEMNRASYDEWQIDACPHHGPTMIQSKLSGDYHISWFTNGDLHQGIYYARYSFDEGKPQHVFRVDGRAGAGHPHLGEYAETLYLVWKGFDGQSTNLSLIKSIDDGASWTDPRILFSTAQGSDHPLIVSGNDGLYLSWHTQEMGYVFEKITANEEVQPGD
ncbi:MAG: exo-alpha-sialidase [Gammaproteobacteria bacterium]|nr:exo-alpha-sialidase [Gammaproteobacteria bacterium]